MATISRYFRSVWRVIAIRKETMSGVVTHDPAASRPHNLDDPFFDQEAQERIAKVIAKSATSKKRLVGRDLGGYGCKVGVPR